MAADRVYKQRVVIHGIDDEELVTIKADEASKTLGVNLQVWDVDDLQYIRVTKDMMDSDFPTFATTRFEWINGNCIYKGDHENLNASIDDVNWYIYKYDYDGSDCTMKRFSKGAWSDRANLWA